jgi:nucleoid-associated protein YgaU
MAKKEEKKGILDKALDALTGRDEKEAAEEAKKEAQAAERNVALEQAKREAAEAKARAAEAKLKEAEEKVKEAEEKAAREEREKRLEAAAARREARREAMELRAERLREQERTYTVKSGDSLSKIAKELLGDAKRWPEIFEANKDQIKDPNLIHPGQELKIPAK